MGHNKSIVQSNTENLRISQEIWQYLKLLNWTIKSDIICDDLLKGELYTPSGDISVYFKWEVSQKEKPGLIGVWNFITHRDNGININKTLEINSFDNDIVDEEYIKFIDTIIEDLACLN